MVARNLSKAIDGEKPPDVAVLEHALLGREGGREEKRAGERESVRARKGVKRGS